MWFEILLCYLIFVGKLMYCCIITRFFLIIFFGDNKSHRIVNNYWNVHFTCLWLNNDLCLRVNATPKVELRERYTNCNVFCSLNYETTQSSYCTLIITLRQLLLPLTAQWKSLFDNFESTIVTFFAAWVTIAKDMWK